MLETLLHLLVALTVLTTLGAVRGRWPRGVPILVGSAVLAIATVEHGSASGWGFLASVLLMVVAAIGGLVGLALLGSQRREHAIAPRARVVKR